MTGAARGAPRPPLTTHREPNGDQTCQKAFHIPNPRRPRNPNQTYPQQMIDFTAQPGRQLGKTMCRYFGKIMCRHLGKIMCRLSILTKADLARHTKSPKVAAHGLANCRLHFGPKLSHKTDPNTAARIGPAELAKAGPHYLGISCAAIHLSHGSDHWGNRGPFSTGWTEHCETDCTDPNNWRWATPTCKAKVSPERTDSMTRRILRVRTT